MVGRVTNHQKLKKMVNNLVPMDLEARRTGDLEGQRQRTSRHAARTRKARRQRTLKGGAVDAALV